MSINIGWGIPISVVGLVIVSVVGGLTVYSGVPYAVDRAAAFVDLAAATNNLTETITDLNQTLILIEPFHGNPAWFFATVHTDFDQVRQQIQTTISAALKVIPLGPESFAYQQALKNIQSDLTTTIEGEPIGKIAERLLRLAAVYWTPMGEYPVERLDEVAQEGARPIRYESKVSARGWQAEAVAA